MKKTLTTLAIAGSLTFLGAGAAQADALYAPPVVGTNVEDGTVAPGETFDFVGSGFEPGEIIDVTITLVPAPAAGAGGAGLGGAFGAGFSGVIIPATVVDNTTVTADEDGNFALPVTLTEVGTYTLTAEGRESGHTETASITVAVPSANDNSGVGGGTGTGTDGDDAANEDAVANGEQLADTGLDSSALLWGGAGVLALGAGATAVVVSRRKNA